MQKIFSKKIFSVEILIFLGTILFVFYLHYPFISSSPNLYDEGVSLFGAKRFLNGEIPYRDFWTMYAPAKFYFLAGVFKIFGTNLFIARIFYFLISIFGFSIIFIFFWRNIGFLSAFLVTILTAGFGKISLTPVFVILLAIILSEFFRYPEKIFLALLFGITNGLLFSLRIDFGGFFALLGFLLVSLFFIFKQKFFSKKFFMSAGIALFGFLVTILVFFLPIFLQGGFQDFLEQAIYFPIFGKYQELRKLPFPNFSDFYSIKNFSQFCFNLSWFFWIIPFLTSFFFWFIKIFSKNKKADFLKKNFPDKFLQNLFFAGATLASLLYVSHRADFGHTFFLNFFAIIFLIHTLFLFSRKIFMLPFFLPIIFIFIPIGEKFFQKSENNFEQKQFSFFRFSLPNSPENENLEKVLQFFEKNISKQELIFVGVENFDRIFINNVLLYFLLPNQSATKFHELHTGVTTSKNIQLEILQELEKINFVVLWDFFICEPNLSCQSSRNNLPKEYIEKNFENIAEFGRYKILKRK